MREGPSFLHSSLSLWPKRSIAPCSPHLSSVHFSFPTPKAETEDDRNRKLPWGANGFFFVCARVRRNQIYYSGEWATNESIALLLCFPSLFIFFFLCPVETKWHCQWKKRTKDWKQWRQKVCQTGTETTDMRDMGRSRVTGNRGERILITITVSLACCTKSVYTVLALFIGKSYLPVVR